MAKKPRVIVVVLNWNDGKSTLASVKSVLSSDYAPLSVVLVDNASTDGSFAQLRRAFGANKRVTLVTNRTNLGYVGNNTGIAKALAARADYVFILNNDAIVSRDCIYRLVKLALAKPHAAAVAPLIVYESDPQRVWSAGTSFNQLFFKPSLIGIGASAKSFTEVAEVPLAVGAALLVRAGALRRVGLLDEN